MPAREKGDVFRVQVFDVVGARRWLEVTAIRIDIEDVRVSSDIC